VTLREEHRLRVFENSVLRGISGPNMDEIIRGCRKLYNEELHNLSSSQNIISKHGREEKCIQGFGTKS
jgi:hypothetical protein